MKQSTFLIPENRVLSLDAFRGMTIMLMILVNNLGSYSHAPSQLVHATWHGCTLADLVFPFFLFIMGTTMAFSFNTYTIPGNNRKLLYKKIMQRTLLLFSIGIASHLVPYFDFQTVRIFGVLQRIALCYFFVSVLTSNTGMQTQVIITALLLAGYWLIMEVVPFPGKGNDPWAFGNNCAQYFDTLILGKHTWKKGLEPEGIISTIPAIATTMLGFMSGKWLNSKHSLLKKNLVLFVAALVLLASALLWELVMPVNKQLWTGSYALLTAAIALFVLGCIYFLLEVADFKNMFWWAFVLGSNSLVIYVLSSLVAKMVYLIPLSTANGKTISIKMFAATFLQNLTSPIIGSVGYAILYLSLWFLVALWLYKKRVFFKV